MPDNSVLSIAQDSTGYLYFSTKAGTARFNGYKFEMDSLYRFDPKPVISLPEELSTVSSEKNVTAIFQDRQGSYWIGTSDEGIYYAPSANASEDLNIFFEFIGMNNKKFDRPEALITIPYEYETLSIGYVAFDYIPMGSLQYRYKIQGIHDDWVETPDNKIQFTSLPDGGIYSFNVQARRRDGAWGPASTMEMDFLTPFYKELWFALTAVSVGLILFWLLIRSYFKRKLKIQQMRSEILQLESKALQSQMNPHFVFNSLNSIQSFISAGDSFKSEVYLSKFSALLRKTLDHSRADKISLSKEIDHLRNYLELEKLRFPDTLSYRIEEAGDLERDLIMVPPMLVQPFVENAIVHGLGPKKGGGEVIVRFSSDGETSLICTITDNGVGRSPEPKNMHDSLGSSIVEKRLELISRDSIKRVRYKDLKDDKGDPVGTEVEIEIPV